MTPAAPAQKPLFSADGESIPTNTAAIGGGGGGGAINLLFKKSQGSFAVSANGGSGGDNNSVWESTPGGAGNGGGGFISAVVCDLGTSTLASDIDWEAIAGSNEWKVDYGDGSQDGTLKITGLRSRTSPDGMHICGSY